MWSQNDPRWKNKRLGGGPNTIGQDGCYLSSGADLETWAGHSVDPAAMDDIAHFVQSELLADSWLQDIMPARWKLEAVYNYASSPADQSKLNNDDPNVYVIVGLTGGSLGSGWHFSPIVNWHVPTIADTVPYPAQERSPSVWGLPWKQQVAKVIVYRYLGGGAPAPQPVPVPPPAPVAFHGVVASPAHVRILPGTDQQVVQQGGTNPDVVDAGIGLSFDAWTHHVSKGGTDVVVMDDSYHPPRADDRWFRTSPGHHWMASAGINYANGADPPASLLVADPAAAPAPPAPLPAPPSDKPVAFTGDAGALMSPGLWEWNDQGDYAKLRATGYRYVLIRAANGEGGTTDAAQYQAWGSRSSLARGAGLRAYAWAYWYGPGDAGYTETDPAAYLMRCVDHLVARQIDTAAFVIDYEQRDQTGLAAALKSLRDRTGKAVFLAPPGDPVEYGMRDWDWAKLDAAVDGYVPQFYTGAWNGSISFQHAFGEWSGRKPIFPASDEPDAVKAQQWAQQALTDGITGWSVWRIGSLSEAALAAYAQTTPLPSPDPVPPPGPSPVPDPPKPVDPIPTPPPPPPVGSWLQALIDWLIKLLSRK